MLEIRSDVEDAVTLQDFLRIRSETENSASEIIPLLEAHLVKKDVEKISSTAVRLQYLYKVCSLSYHLCKSTVHHDPPVLTMSTIDYC